MASDDHYIVMIPFMAHGHLIPFLSLANLIERRTGFTIIIASTPLNVQYLHSNISKLSSSSNIRLAELPFCSTDHGLPPNTENTEVLPLNLMTTLFHSSVSLKPHLHGLLVDLIEEKGRPPLCLISDVFFGWAVEVAKSVGTLNISFSTGGAYGTAAYISVWQHLPHRKTESDEFLLPGFPERCRFHKSQLHQFIRSADGTDPWSTFFQPQIALSLKSDGCLCNSVEEIEPLGLEIMRNYMKIPVWCLAASVSGQRTGKSPGISPAKCMEWLNQKQEKSVVYVSFGSQNTISLNQMMELAYGLEESGKNFVWVIRPPIGFDIRGEFRSEWLPEKFEERMAGRGLLVRNWAPQFEILSHKSVGAFLSHCGWNSVMESLRNGVPIIGWPMAAEQMYNSKMMVEEMGVAVELTRGKESNVGRKEVRKVIEMVMEKGEKMKMKAEEIGRMIMEAVMEEGGRIGSSVKAMDDFIRWILSKREEAIA